MPQAGSYRPYGLPRVAGCGQRHVVVTLEHSGSRLDKPMDGRVQVDRQPDRLHRIVLYAEYVVAMRSRRASPEALRSSVVRQVPQRSRSNRHPPCAWLGSMAHPASPRQVIRCRRAPPRRFAARLVNTRGVHQVISTVRVMFADAAELHAIRASASAGRSTAGVEYVVPVHPVRRALESWRAEGWEHFTGRKPRPDNLVARRGEPHHASEAVAGLRLLRPRQRAVAAHVPRRPLRRRAGMGGDGARPSALRLRGAPRRYAQGGGDQTKNPRNRTKLRGVQVVTRTGFEPMFSA